MSLAPSDSGLIATIRPDRAAASMRCPGEGDAFVEGRRRRPAVVDHDEQRSGAGEAGEAVPQRLRHGQNDQRRHRHAQSQDRPGRARRLRLVRSEPDEQAQRREHRSPGRRRRHAQEEIERAEPDERHQDGRRGKMSGMPNTCQAAPYAAPSSGAERRMRNASRVSAAEPSVRLRLMPQPRLAQMRRSASRCAASLAR